MKNKGKKVWCFLLCTAMLLTTAPLQSYEVRAAENSVTEGSVEEKEKENTAQGTSVESPTVETTESVSQEESGCEGETGNEGETVSEAETENESEPEGETETGTENETKTPPETEIESETETSPETETKSETETQTETETESETETQTETETESETETQTETETESETETQTETETEEDDGRPTVIMKHNGNPKQDGENAIYANPAFVFEVSDAGNLDKLKTEITGIPGGVKKPAISKEKTEEETVRYTVKFESGTYSNNVKFEVENEEGKIAKIKVFSAEKNIVENEAPTFSISATAGGENYDGSLTNEQIVMTVEIQKCLSGVEKVEVIYCEGDSEPDDNTQWNTVEQDTETKKYQVVVGKDLEKKTIPDTNMIPEKLTVENPQGGVVNDGATEKFTQNGKYYFRVTSKAGNKSTDNNAYKKVNIKQQKVEATVSAYANIECGENGWYSQSRPYIKVSSKKVEDSNEVTTCLAVYKKVKTEDGIKEEKVVEEIDVESTNHQKVTDPGGKEYDYRVEKDECYYIYAYTKDDAGNIGEIRKYEANVDTEVSEEISLHISLVHDEDITENMESICQEEQKVYEGNSDEEDNKEEGIEEKILYSQFFNGAVKVEITGEDSVSGINKAESSWSTNGENSVKLEKLVIDENGRYHVKAKVYDYAGNIKELSSGGFVVDDVAPVINGTDELTVRAKGAGKSGFINDNCFIDVNVQDLPEVQNNKNDEDIKQKYAGLKSVLYEISDSSGQVLKEGSVFNSELASASTEQLDAQGKAEGEIKVEGIEGNDLTVKVTAIDNAENSKEATTEISIDKTKPEITVEFADGATESGKYYAEDRVAHITVTELNFDPKEVKLEVTKDGVATAASLGGWQSGGDVHTADLSFKEDGQYAFKISCTDLAGNTAEGPEIVPFTIDKTEPEVTISYNTKQYVEGYFNSRVTATVTVEEANFSASEFKLSAYQQAVLGAWSHNGNIHTANIAFNEDGEYTWKVDCTDLAGNRMAEMEAEHFIIDTVLPEVTITGVEDESANAGEVAPVVTIVDENLNLDDTEIKLTNGKGQLIMLEKKVTPISNGFTYELTNVSGQKDSVYHLSVTGIDKAGNESELTYRFSLNRNGSTFDFSGVRDIVERVYNKSKDLTDIKILETNVDKIENFEIYINRNGKMIRGTEVSKRPSKNKSDAVYYTVKQRGDENSGYTYEYIIFKENFAEEGTYNLTFSSVDRAGNRKNNTQADKEDTIGFIVDDTVPQVFIEGVENNTVYEADELDINVYVTDNFDLKDAEFYLVNESGEKVEVWDYMELAKEAGDSITLTIPGSTERHSLLYKVSDAAGNELTVKAGDKGVPSEFLITTEKVSEIGNAQTPGTSAVKTMAGASGASISAPIVRFAGAVAAGVVIIGTAVIVGRRKRLKEFGEQ